MHVEYLGKTKAKQKDHSPSMTLSWLPIQNDLVPQKFAKILSTIVIMVNMMTHACPV